MDSDMDSVEVIGENVNGFHQVLTTEAIKFLCQLHCRFNEKLLTLLSERKVREEAAAQSLPKFRRDTVNIRASHWKVDLVPEQFRIRAVDVVLPIVDQDTALDVAATAATGIQADFDDSHCPSWFNNIRGQIILKELVKKCCESPSSAPDVLPRPRSLHMFESNIRDNEGKPISGALFDFAMFLFHNCKILIQHGLHPCFYLPKLTCMEEAQLWNDIFEFSQEILNIPSVLSIKCIVLIEDILSAFEMDEILHALRSHCIALNAGKFDYVFSFIKKLTKDRPQLVLPSRDQITSKATFLKTYQDLLVSTCHRRGALATTGMFPFLTVSPDTVEMAYNLKLAEAQCGSQGALVAHSGFIEAVASAFRDGACDGAKFTRTLNLGSEAEIEANLVSVPTGTVSIADIRGHLRVLIEYCHAWTVGQGNIVINDMFEDIATAEICRSLLWQWCHHCVALEDGRTVDQALLQSTTNLTFDHILSKQPASAAWTRTKAIVHQLLASTDLPEFLSDVLMPDISAFPPKS